MRRIVFSAALTWVVSLTPSSSQAEAPLSLVKTQVLSTEGPTHGVTWSPDGHRLATYSSHGNKVYVWEELSGQRIATLQRLGARYVGDGLAFVNNGREIVTPSAQYGAKDIAISIFNINSSQVIKELIGPFPELERNVNSATNIAYSEKTKKLVVIFGAARASHIGIYSTISWQEIAKIGEDQVSHFPVNSSIALSYDGNLLAIGRTDGTILIYNLQTVKLINVIDTGFSVNSAGVWSLAFNPDGEFVVCGTGPTGFDPKYNNQTPLYDHSPIKIFRVSDGLLLRSFKADIQPVYSVSWSSTGKYIASTGNGGSLYIWRPGDISDTDIPVSIMSNVNTVSFSPDGSQLAINNENFVTVIAIEHP